MTSQSVCLVSQFCLAKGVSSIVCQGKGQEKAGQEEERKKNPYVNKNYSLVELRSVEEEYLKRLGKTWV